MGKMGPEQKEAQVASNILLNIVFPEDPSVLTGWGILNRKSVKDEWGSPPKYFYRDSKNFAPKGQYVANNGLIVPIGMFFSRGKQIGVVTANGRETQGLNMRFIHNSCSTLNPRALDLFSLPDKLTGQFDGFLVENVDALSNGLHQISSMATSGALMRASFQTTELTEKMAFLEKLQGLGWETAVLLTRNDSFSSVLVAAKI